MVPFDTSGALEAGFRSEQSNPFPPTIFFNDLSRLSRLSCTRLLIKL